MKLYRIISKEEWIITLFEGKVPRCRSDEQENSIHLNEYKDLVIVANKFFLKEEEPVVLEIECDLLKAHIKWISPTICKPWHQPNLHIENIPSFFILKFCYMYFNEKLKTFEIPESFLK